MHTGTEGLSWQEVTRIRRRLHNRQKNKAKLQARKDKFLGRQFGFLTVLEHYGGQDWLCRCDCGTEKVIEQRNLTRVQVPSCGCLKGKPIEPGRKFGHLTTIEQSGRQWLCECVCGKETSVDSRNLWTGNTSSCGCQRFSAAHRRKLSRAKNGIY